MSKKYVLNINSIGLIGVGLMGIGIGINILKSGRELFVLKYKNGRNIRKLKTLGAHLKNSYAEIASSCEVIILCLPNSLMVEKVMLGEHGLINFLRTGSIIIDCTTSEPSSVLLIKNLLVRRGIYFMDAPLTRSPKESIAGKLNIMVGGDQHAYNVIEPVVKTFAENIFYVGESGSGSKLKLVNNFISMSFIMIVIYALAYAKEENIDLKELDKIMAKGSNYIPAIPLMIKWLFNSKESVLQFSIRNANKDMSYFRNLVKKHKMDHKLLNALVDNFNEASQSKVGNKMLPDLFNFIINSEK